MVQVDHDLLDPRVPQQLQREGNHRPASDLDQRLRHRIGERPQPRSLARRQNHGAHAVYLGR